MWLVVIIVSIIIKHVWYAYIQTDVCNVDDEQLVFAGGDQPLPEYVLTQPFSFSSNSLVQACTAPCLCGPGGYSDNFDSGSYRYINDV